MTEAVTPARSAILHVDDVGMCHGANIAFLKLFRVGFVDSGSVMVPCPWFSDIAAAARADRSLDLGVHLTLTSEWDHYRWRALSTVSRASGLVDDDGFLPKNCPRLRANIVPEACEIELRAQIDRALAAGIDATHLDTHMGAALVPELLEIYLKLGLEYRLPVLLPRDLASYINVLNLGAVDPAPYAAAVAALDHAGAAIVNQFCMAPGTAKGDAEPVYRHLFSTLAPGLTFVSLHCNAPGDIETIAPLHAHWRTEEYRFFASGAAKKCQISQGITRQNYRDLRERLRA